MNESNPYAAPAAEHAVDSVDSRKLGRRAWPYFLAGVFTIFIDFVQLVIVVGVFNLDDNEPDWEIYYAFFTMVILPLAGLGWFLVGLIRLFRGP